MTLDVFLSDKTLTAVEVLPDQRLINAVINLGELYGVIVSSIPKDAQVTRLSPVTLSGTTISVDALTFDATQYTMLD